MSLLPPSLVEAHTKPQRAARTAPTISQAWQQSWKGRPLQTRPGFLIRRLHQIHVALFTRECASEGLTPVQYSVLTALDHLVTADQATLARSVGLDRTSITDVIARLERRDLLVRTASPRDGRLKLASLTPAGQALLARVDQAAQRAHDLTISALPAGRQRQFLDDLMQLVEAHGDAAALQSPTAD